ncbi:hypothetical protein [uncultured Clostridium sp.]|uniref:hypothetical protein n=1 Tax=uncultured Clostridium sp. TaxID=59620 RepID=UPI00260816CA|nr:hypothetical protein [uncultured Clostridium sp.]
MTKREIVQFMAIANGVPEVDLSKIETKDLVAELRSREEVKFHYVEEGMECTLETNEFDGEIEGPLILLEIEDWELKGE